MTDQSPAIPRWDAKIALENIEGDESDLKDLFEIWLAEEPMLRSRIQIALDDADPKEVHLAAHTLKGSLKLFGFTDALTKAAELENAGKTSRVADGLDLFRQLENELKLVNHQVRSFLAID